MGMMTAERGQGVECPCLLLAFGPLQKTILAALQSALLSCSREQIFLLPRALFCSREQISAPGQFLVSIILPL
jgi:hypothetical protein